MAYFAHINTSSRSRQRMANNTREYVKKIRENEQKDNIKKDEIDKKREEEKEKENELIRVASDPNTSKEKLIELSQNSNNRIVVGVLDNPNCPIEVLEILSNHENDYIRTLVAGHKNCDDKLLHKLATDSNVNVKYNIAIRDDCPLDILFQLINDEYLYVREAVVRNPIFPIETLIEIAKKKEDIKIELLRYVKFEEITGDKLDKLVQLGYEFCDAIVDNPNCNISTLEKIANFKFNLKSRYSIISARNRLIKKAGNLKTTEEDLKELANSKIAAVRQAVADNPSCTLSLLEYLFDNNLIGMPNKKARERLKECKKSKKFKSIQKEIIQDSKNESVSFEMSKEELNCNESLKR